MASGLLLGLFVSSQAVVTLSIDGPSQVLNAANATYSDFALPGGLPSKININSDHPIRWQLMAEAAPAADGSNPPIAPTSLSLVPADAIKGRNDGAFARGPMVFGNPVVVAQGVSVGQAAMGAFLLKGAIDRFTAPGLYQGVIHFQLLVQGEQPVPFDLPYAYKVDPWITIAPYPRGLEFNAAAPGVTSPKAPTFVIVETNNAAARVRFSLDGLQGPNGNIPASRTGISAYMDVNATKSGAVSGLAQNSQVVGVRRGSSKIWITGTLKTEAADRAGSYSGTLNIEVQQ